MDSLIESHRNLFEFPFPVRKPIQSINEELVQKAPIISVTRYTETPKYIRVWRSKKHQCGLYTRKNKVLLTITSRKIIEETMPCGASSTRIEMDLAFIDLAFIGAHESGKCRFLIADTRNHLKRMYEVSSQPELVTWFSLIHRAVSILKQDIDQYTPRQSLQELLVKTRSIQEPSAEFPLENNLESPADNYQISENLLPILHKADELKKDITRLSINLEDFSSTCCKSVGRLEEMEETVDRLRHTRTQA